MVDPTVAPVGAPACLSNTIAGRDGIVLSVESAADTIAPSGGVPDTVAVLAT